MCSEDSKLPQADTTGQNTPLMHGFFSDIDILETARGFLASRHQDRPSPGTESGNVRRPSLPCQHTT